MRKKKFLQIVSMYVVLNLLAQYIMPTAAYALTSGPSQPEVESFEPVGTTQMVDMFSGDFNYNIPLLTVPGPNGGYPVNLAYHAGIGMEQEASWVGLGWNINPGEINRSMRGLPDDFNGAKVTKQVSMKPNNTFSIEGHAPIPNLEFCGFKSGSFSDQLYYNNYKGVGMQLGVGLTSMEQSLDAPKFGVSLSLTLDPDAGLGVNPSMEYSAVRGDHAYLFHIGFSYSSHEGLYNISLKAERENVVKHQIDVLTMVNQGDCDERVETTPVTIATGLQGHSNQSAGVNFSSASFVPNISMPEHGMNIRAGFNFGKVYGPMGFDYKSLGGTEGSISMQWADNDPVDYGAYGYVYENGGSASDMHDINREKDVPPTKDIPNMPVPIQTYDTYIIKGQGIGGTFRPYRSDVPVYSDPIISDFIPTVAYTQEIGADLTGDSHLGAGVGVGYSSSYSGPWQNLGTGITDNFGSTAAVANSLSEPVYFRVAGDVSESTPFASTFINEEPVSFDISLAYNGISLKPKIGNTLKGKYSGTTLSQTGTAQRSYREKRNEQVEYYTNNQIDDLDGIYKNDNLYNFDSYPNDYSPSGPNHITYLHHRSGEFSNAAYNSQFGAISVLNPDGNRYVYSLPAINKQQKETVFSARDYIAPENAPRISNYYPTYHENDKDNTEGYDHYFSKIEVPAYAHSFLLSAIVSPDYVDLLGDGPTNDDIGYWVKFNYSRTDDFGWRVPYGEKKANVNREFISNPDFNKLSYTWGNKEIYYLNSVETKTHVAHFILNDDASDIRQDAVSASSTDDGNSNTSRHHSRYLKKIELYSKRDLEAYHSIHSDNNYESLAIKCVNFEYDYSLCGNVENNLGSSVVVNGSNINARKGKLTLKKVWFSYRGNTKGQLSPYQFDYHALDGSGNPTSENPDYDLAAMDRWGNYQPENPGDTIFNSENPYVNQSDTAAINRNAAVWSLKEITMPTGAVMKMQYESDNYAYVQEKQAMQMFQIVDLTNNLDTTVHSQEMSKDNTCIRFKLKTPIDPSDPHAMDKLHAYAEGIDRLYFKTFQRIKKYYPSNNPTSGTSRTTYDYANDYVEGYATISKTNGVPNMGLTAHQSDGKYHGGYIQVETEEVNKVPGIKHVHPFRKAGWQYLRLRRSDLTVPGNDLGGAVFNLAAVGPVYNLLMSAGQMLTGYYNWCAMTGCCRYLTTPSLNGSDYYRPSYIRLNTPDKIKYGGGHRVHSIVMDDNWDDMVDGVTPAISSVQDGHEAESHFGQYYTYAMPDGSSSGVADYEPLIGGEEIPQHLPVAYSSNKFLSNDKALFLEEPIGESFYPSASVGYRRIIVRNLDRSSVSATKNATGITEYQYYTSKEFPVHIDYTVAEHKKYVLPLLIPFVGKLGFNNKGYSQGYSIELNDMNGKAKSVATYSSHANLNDPTQQPATKMEFIYQTKAPFSEETPNYLENTVTVLDADAAYRSGTIGVTSDFYVDMRENYNFTFCENYDPNLDLSALPAVSFSIAPSYELSEAMFRSVVNVKAFYKTGILVETKVYDNGSSVSTKNLMFDSQTGQPLLTTVTNDFNAPVYTYKYAAHWAYDGMNSAGENWGAKFTFASGITSGIAAFNSPSGGFFEGDELLHYNSSGTLLGKLWVDLVNDPVGTGSDYVKLINEDGTLATGSSTDTYILVRSGRRNQQTVTNGTIVSLSNPVTSRQFPLFGAFNTFLLTHHPDDDTLSSRQFNFVDCLTGETIEVTFSVPTTNHLNIVGNGCEAQIIFPENKMYITSADQLDQFTFTKVGNTVQITDPSAPGIIFSGQWINTQNCFHECIPDVLHADAARFASNWKHNYSDFGDPDIQYSGGSAQPLSSATTSTYNRFRVGESGVWRTQSSFLYQIDRKQSAPQTDISKDGTYQSFIPYNWLATQQNNPQWSLVNRITLYSPFGYELENVDTIGIYSSAIYGYRNSLATAVTSNARYLETGFDGFEDYDGTYPDIIGTSPWGHGHVLFKTGSTTYPSKSNVFAHTGTQSLEIGTTPAEFTTLPVAAYNPNGLIFEPIAGKEYYASFWVKHATDKTTGYTTAYLKINGTTVSSVNTSKDDIIIEGWHYVTMRIPAMSLSDIMTIGIESNDPSSGNIYMDDFRIQPFTSAITTYVYDPATLWLVAELDNQNFATYYNYDEEGTLVQVKKETMKGIITLRTSRSNIKH